MPISLDWKAYRARNGDAIRVCYNSRVLGRLGLRDGTRMFAKNIGSGTIVGLRGWQLHVLLDKDNGRSSFFTLRLDQGARSVADAGVFVDPRTALCREDVDVMLAHVGLAALPALLSTADDVSSGPSVAEVDAASAEVEGARMAYEEAERALFPDTDNSSKVVEVSESAEATYDAAKAKLQAATAAYERLVEAKAGADEARERRKAAAIAAAESSKTDSRPKEKFAPFKTRKGVVVKLNVAERALERYNLKPGQRCMTKKGPGEVVGVLMSRVYFRLDCDDGRVSYWSVEPTDKDGFVKHGIYFDVAGGPVDLDALDKELPPDSDDEEEESGEEEKEEEEEEEAAGAEGAGDHGEAGGRVDKGVSYYSRRVERIPGWDKQQLDEMEKFGARKGYSLYRGVDGSPLLVNGNPHSLRRMRVLPGQRALTPRGLATYVGKRGTRSYFKVDADGGATTYWNLERAAPEAFADAGIFFDVTVPPVDAHRYETLEEEEREDRKARKKKRTQALSRAKYQDLMAKAHPRQAEMRDTVGAEERVRREMAELEAKHAEEDRLHVEDYEEGLTDAATDEPIRLNRATLPLKRMRVRADQQCRLKDGSLAYVAGVDEAGQVYVRDSTTDKKVRRLALSEPLLPSSFAAAGIYFSAAGSPPPPRVAVRIARFDKDGNRVGDGDDEPELDEAAIEEIGAAEEAADAARRRPERLDAPATVRGDDPSQFDDKIARLAKEGRADLPAPPKADSMARQNVAYTEGQTAKPARVEKLPLFSTDVLESHTNLSQYAWTEDTKKVSVYVEVGQQVPGGGDVSLDDVDASFTERSAGFLLKGYGPDGRNYRFSIVDLRHDIDVDRCKVKVKGSRVQLVLRKTEDFQKKWFKLQIVRKPEDAAPKKKGVRFINLNSRTMEPEGDYSDEELDKIPWR